MKTFKPYISRISFFCLLTLITGCQTTEQKIDTTPLPKVAQEHKRVYLMKQSFNHVIDKEEIGLSNLGKTGLIVLSLAVGSALVSNNMSHLIPSSSSQRNLDNSYEADIFSLNSNTAPITRLTQNSPAQYIDLAMSEQNSIGYGAYMKSLFSSYRNTFGKKNISLDDKWVDIITFGKKHGSQVQDIEPKEKEEVHTTHDNADEDYGPTAYFGITHLKMRHEDAIFCENLKNLDITKKELVKKIEDVSIKFLSEKSHLKSSPRFDLACMAIALAQPTPAAIDQEFSDRSTKHHKKIVAGINKVEYREVNEKPIYLLPQR